MGQDDLDRIGRTSELALHARDASMDAKEESRLTWTCNGLVTAKLTRIYMILKPQLGTVPSKAPNPEKSRSQDPEPVFRQKKRRTNPINDYPRPFQVTPRIGFCLLRQEDIGVGE